MFKKQRGEQQEEIWVSWQAVKDRSGAGALYGKLDDLPGRDPVGRPELKSAYSERLGPFDLLLAA